MSELLFLHDLGQPAAGAPWREAFGQANESGQKWLGDLAVPDLPGHAGTPSPIGGTFDLIEPAMVVARSFVDDPGDPSRTVVGVGRSGWAAHLVALAGRAGRLVLVDGLGGPFLEPAEFTRNRREGMRAVVATTLDGSDGLLGGDQGGMDSRLVHMPGSHSSRDLAHQAAEGLALPVLLLESPASALPNDEVHDLVAKYNTNGGQATLVQLPSANPRTVVDAILAWA